MNILIQSLNQANKGTHIKGNYVQLKRKESFMNWIYGYGNGRSGNNGMMWFWTITSTDPHKSFNLMERTFCVLHIPSLIDGGPDVEMEGLVNRWEAWWLKFGWVVQCLEWVRRTLGWEAYKGRRLTRFEARKPNLAIFDMASNVSFSCVLVWISYIVCLKIWIFT